MGSYQVEVTREARDAIRRMPGMMRQRVLRTLRDLEQLPRPHTSVALDLTKLKLSEALTAEPRRLRLDNWRIIYAVDDTLGLVQVLAVRKRPPYQYEDLNDLLGRLT